MLRQSDAFYLLATSRQYNQKSHKRQYEANTAQQNPSEQVRFDGSKTSLRTKHGFALTVSNADRIYCHITHSLSLLRDSTYLCHFH